MDDATYSLEQLAERTGLEPRTIRSYIEREMLPKAEARGPKSFYGREHLERLTIIHKVRDLQPKARLEDIRSALSGLTSQTIHELAAPHADLGPILEYLDPRPRTDSALDYIRRLKQTRQLSSQRPGSPTSGPATANDSARSLTPVEQLVAVLEKLGELKSVARGNRGAAWHRIEITPDLELSVRATVGDQQLASIHRLCDLLRQLLTRGLPAR